MTPSSGDAKSALEAMRASRERLAAAAECPPARHLAFAGLMGGYVASSAAPQHVALVIEGLLLVGVALIFAWDRRRMGVFVNGYRAGRTRTLTYAILIFTLASWGLGYWLSYERGLAWAPLALGVVAAVVAWFASRAWARIFHRELIETP